MLNYEEELKKFKPCLDVDEVEDAIYSRDLTDVIDILKEMMKNDKPEQENGCGRRNGDLSQLWF